MLSPRALVESWLKGRASLSPENHLNLARKRGTQTPAKLRRVYQWLAQFAIYSPGIDLEFGAPLASKKRNKHFSLREETGYSSFLLLPLLNLLTSRRLLLTGPSGQGKSSVAILMGLLSGYELDDLKQTGHRQQPSAAEILGISNGKGPEEALGEASLGWLNAHVKIVDNFHQMPSGKQSTLLTSISGGYDAMYSRKKAPQSAWFFVADESPDHPSSKLIKGLQEHLDIVVRCPPLHSHFAKLMDVKLSGGRSPESLVPEDIMFSPVELEMAGKEVKRIIMSPEAQDIIGYLASHLDFCKQASTRIESMNKGTLRLSGYKMSQVSTKECADNRAGKLYTQTENSLSLQTIEAWIHFSKALAYFRGKRQASVEEVRQIFPWIALGKLHPNPESAFLQKPENKGYLIDQVSWFHHLFDEAEAQFSKYKPTRQQSVGLKRQYESSSGKLSSSELQQRMDDIQKTTEAILEQHELSGPVCEDLLTLKDLYNHYQNQRSENGGRS